MKKCFFILVAVLFVFALSVNAQQQKIDSSNFPKKNGLKINAGVIFLPCASISLFSFKEMFSTVKCDAPLYFLISLKKGPVSLNPYFMVSKTFTSYNNLYGMFVEYSFPQATLFVVGTKDMKTADVSVGTGAFIPFPKWKWGYLLLELKTPTKEWNPSLVVGMMITGIFPIKK